MCMRSEVPVEVRSRCNVLGICANIPQIHACGQEYVQMSQNCIWELRTCKYLQYVSSSLADVNKSSGINTDVAEIYVGLRNMCKGSEDMHHTQRHVT